MSKRIVPADHFLLTIELNVKNKKLTDEEFREFIRNTLPIVQYKRKSPKSSTFDI